MPTTSPRPLPPAVAPPRRPPDPSSAEHFRRRPGGARAWVRAIRVRQWTKNLLVLGAPAAADALSRPGVLPRVLLTFVVFCLLASGAYLINDARDAEEDRRHPRKRHRPIASGAVSARLAMAAGSACVLLGLALALAVSPALLAVACGYALLNVLYTGWLRRIAVADIAAIAGAFVLRAIAGGVASQVPISRWFILVVSFSALFVAAGKRYADFLDPASRRSREVLEQYSADFLRLVITVACAAALGAYSLWAFGTVGAGEGVWRELTTVPFTLALLRYGLLATAGDGGAPESALFGDPFMLLSGAAWLILFSLGL